MILKRFQPRTTNRADVDLPAPAAIQPRRATTPAEVSGGGRASAAASHDSPAQVHDEAVRLDLTHRVRFSRDALSAANPLLAEMLTLDPDSPRRVVAFLDQGVVNANPSIIERLGDYAAAHSNSFTLTGEPTVIPGGEQAKNDPAILSDILSVIHHARICRRSFVLAIGGGAALDVVGFAAATAHRGVRLVRMPTTTLAQADSGIGVKNGVNLFGKKNYLGAFAVPWAVINDFSFLRTLSDRDWRCGLAEAVKVGLVKDAALYGSIGNQADALGARDEAAAEPIWRRSAELHLQHIARGGDPFELTRARPLDFGHWAAHKLEQMTDYELRHGEAVAIGMAIDVLYAARAGLLDDSQADAAVSLLERLGFSLTHDALADADQLLDGLEEFREHLGGELTITLLRAPGTAVDVHEIDDSAMRLVINQLAGRR